MEDYEVRLSLSWRTLSGVPEVGSLSLLPTEEPS